MTVTSSGGIDVRQLGRWIRGPVIPTAGELEAVPMASVNLALAVNADRMRVVATPHGDRTCVAQLWSPTKGWELA